MEEIKNDLDKVKTQVDALLSKQKLSLYEYIVRFGLLPLCTYLLVSTYQNVQEIKEKVNVSINRIDQIEQRQNNVEKKVYNLTFIPLEATKKEIITLSSLISNL